MEYNWETSDGSYDGKISLSANPNHNMGNLEYKTILNLDLDYLNLLRLLRNEPAKHYPPVEQYTIGQLNATLFGDGEESEDGEEFSGANEGQQDDTRTINDLHQENDEAMQEEIAAAEVRKSTEANEMLPNSDEGDNLGEVDKIASVAVVGDDEAMQGEVRKSTEENEMLLDSNEGDNTGEVDKVTTVAAVEDDGANRGRENSCKSFGGEKTLELENGARGCKRRSREANEEYEAHMQSAVEKLKRLLREGGVHAFDERNSNELKSIKEDVVEKENWGKRSIMQLMLAMDRFNNGVAYNFDLNSVQAENITDESFKFEQGPYVPDGDAEILENAANGTSFVPAVIDHVTENEVAEDAGEMGFKRDLMKILKKPFDEEEYEDLYKRFNEGPYRHIYPSAGRILNKNRYLKKNRLNILRGFFFWDEKMNREGSFRPWEDKEWLVVRQKTRYMDQNQVSIPLPQAQIT